MLVESVLGLPVDSFPVIAIAVFLLLVVVAITPFWTREVVPRLLDFLACSSEGASFKRHT